MITDPKDLETQRKLLRAPFPDNMVSELPKETKKQKDDRIANGSLGIKCPKCDSWHHKDAIHLSYVGHAAITDRLLAVDPEWKWEPLAYTPEGLPRFDETGGLWIRLTVLGITRLGYGHAMVKPFGEPGNREKEVIGDALRNAGMRFGMGLDLWHKGGPMHDDEGDRPPGPTPPQEPVAPAKAKRAPKVAPPADPGFGTGVEATAPKPAAKLIDVLEAFRRAPDEAALQEAGKQAEELAQKDLKAARTAYGTRLKELRVRAGLLTKLRPVMRDDERRQAVVDFCGAQLGVMLQKPSDLESFDIELLTAIDEWLGNTPEVV